MNGKKKGAAPMEQPQQGGFGLQRNEVAGFGAHRVGRVHIRVLRSRVNCGTDVRTGVAVVIHAPGLPGDVQVMTGRLLRPFFVAERTVCAARKRACKAGHDSQHRQFNF